MTVCIPSSSSSPLQVPQSSKVTVMTFSTQVPRVSLGKHECISSK